MNVVQRGRIGIVLSAALAGVLALGSGAAAAQAFPSKPIRMIVPYPAGGGADLMARYLCERFTPALGQPCVVENRGGAGGIIGMEMMLKADADGHTLAVMPSNLAIIPGLYPKVPYDTVRDVAPIGLVTTTPIMIGTHPSVRAQTLTELLAEARGNAGKVNFTTCGPASPQHLAGEMLGALASVQWQHVPYKGCGNALTDVLSGTVPIFISTYAHFAPQIKAGKLRGLAMLSEKRSQFAPSVPTVAETGFPGFDVEVWFGLVGNAKTPAPVLDRLNAELNRALQAPDLRQKLLDGQYEPIGGTSERFASVIRRDMERFAKAIRDVGIRPE
jgi:tripartite-type tricarboxylate transporter receptor subunit TctC